MRPTIRTALALGLLCAAGRVAASAADLERVLPFVADDYGKALAEARAQKLPLFIEAWAPW
ncbi:MAG TPA: hypothetical protein VL691_08340 [Vicinamibacteria bacterium]|nr:hypothetical protein [Vicinamibacteria bacterium]